MFGMGFMEIFLVLIVAVIALGPEKLPTAAVDMVRFFRKFKSSIDDAKKTLDDELNIAQMKQDAQSFKSSIGEISNIASVDIDDLSNITDDDTTTQKQPKLTQEQQAQKLASEIIPNKEPQVVAKKEKISLNNNNEGA